MYDIVVTLFIVGFFIWNELDNCSSELKRIREELTKIREGRK